MLLIGRAAWEVWFNQSKALPRSGFVSQTSLGGETSGSVAKWRLFSQATNFALGLIWFSNLALHWQFLRLFETIRARAFFVCFCENSFLRRAEKTQTRKNRKNVIPCPVEPRYIEGPRDFGFVISRSFSIYVTITGKENRSSFVRGSTVIR